MREYIIYYQSVGSDITQEYKLTASTLQDAINIFRTKYPERVVINAEGPYDVR